MSALYMLDTSTCVILMKRTSATLEQRIQQVPLEQQVMSAITFAELTDAVHAGTPNSQSENQAVLDGLIAHLRVLDWPREAATAYADVRRCMQKSGVQLRAADVLIAAHALTAGATVVTANPEGFGGISRLDVENWLEA